MAHVNLFFGGEKIKRKQAIFEGIKKESPDVFIIEKDDEKKSIGIDKIREAIKFLQEKPFELKNKYLIIEQANILTHEAQNALLKTLEEPPSYADIRLGSKAEKDLLDTVISRCKRIDLNKKEKSRGVDEKNEKVYIYENFSALPTGQKLDFIEDLAKEEKEIIIDVLENWLSEERLRILAIKGNNTHMIEKIIKAIEDLNTTNMNTKFILEYLVIT